MSLLKKLTSAVNKDHTLDDDRHSIDTGSETGTNSIKPSIMQSFKPHMVAKLKKKMSSAALMTNKPILETAFENTYRMGPEDKDKFSYPRVKEVCKGVLAQYLRDMEYNPKICARMSQRISDEIKKKVKQLGFVRYKLVCVVVIGQKNAQSFQYASRCLWDEKKDSVASASFENKSLFATATVFGTYFE